MDTVDDYVDSSSSEILEYDSSSKCSFDLSSSSDDSDDCREFINDIKCVHISHVKYKIIFVM